jgi:hypothetical protein
MRRSYASATDEKTIFLPANAGLWRSLRPHRCHTRALRGSDLDAALGKQVGLSHKTAFDELEDSAITFAEDSQVVFSWRAPLIVSPRRLWAE